MLLKYIQQYMNPLAISLCVPYHTAERWEDKKYFSSKDTKTLWR